MAVVDYNSSIKADPNAELRKIFTQGKWKRRFYHFLLMAEVTAIAFLAPPAMQTIINSYLP